MAPLFREPPAGTPEHDSFVAGQRFMMSPSGRVVAAFVNGLVSGVGGAAFGAATALSRRVGPARVPLRDSAPYVWQMARSFATVTWLYNGSEIVVDT
jgi:hypothetical protein